MDNFDYIIIDETHRSGADSYLRLIEHFKPQFLLGMTATPERTDGNDIFQLFDHNIAYEIRLSRAMEEEMLSSSLSDRVRNARDVKAIHFQPIHETKILEAIGGHLRSSEVIGGHGRP